MDPRLLKFYNRELQHLREVGGEFANKFPKIAGRLGMDSFEVADPYVERLLEGFAFIAARLQLKIEAEFPRFTQHLLEAVFPHYMAPLPSMAVIQLQPDLTEGTLEGGFLVSRDSVLRSPLGKGERTSCEFRTAHDVTLWPLELTAVDYLPTPGSLAKAGVPDLPRGKAGLRLMLHATAGLTFDKLPLNDLTLFLRGGDVAMHLYEQLLGNSVAVVASPGDRSRPWQEIIPRSEIGPLGFDDNQALLPQTPRTFSGYRLLMEYFALPERFLFVNLSGLARAVARCESDELELIVVFDRSDPELENVLSPDDFALHCTPAINLFPKRADRIHISDSRYEHHVLADRTRPMDFEIYTVNKVLGIGSNTKEEQEFLPFYSSTDVALHDAEHAYYTLRREPRLLSQKQRRRGPRSSYAGNEVFVTLVDAHQAPYSAELRQLALEVLCTNRDLPMMLPVGKGKSDFTMESGAPVNAVRCLAGPTMPHPTHAEGETAWRLINHLSLNYLSMTDSGEERGACALREMLMLYGERHGPSQRRQIEGIRSVTTCPVNRRLPGPGPIAFGRGIEVALSCDESAFEGAGIFLLGAVLDQFIARYASINSFTQTVMRSTVRGEIMRWPLRAGLRHNL